MRSSAIDPKEMFSYEPSSVPFALSHKDCGLRKSEKIVLMSILEERVYVFPQLPSEGNIPTAVMIYGMAFTRNYVQVAQLTLVIFACVIIASL